LENLRLKKRAVNWGGVGEEGARGEGVQELQELQNGFRDSDCLLLNFTPIQALKRNISNSELLNS
jgi:hypothetical protein